MEVFMVTSTVQEEIFDGDGYYNKNYNQNSDKNADTSNSIVNRILPDCYLYISHLDEDFQYWLLPGYPDNISDNMTVNFQPSTALGRSAPVYTFSNSGPRTVAISLEFHRDMFEDMNQLAMYKGKIKTDSNPNGIYEDTDDLVDHFIHAIQAIALPKYNLSNKAIEPPLVAVRFGREVFIKGIVSSNVQVTYRKPILVNERYAIVKIDFTITEVDPYDSTTVFKNGSFRGMTATLRSGMYF
jgi:hypothetical protein